LWHTWEVWCVCMCLSSRNSTWKASWHSGQWNCFEWAARWNCISSSVAKLSRQNRQRKGCCVGVLLAAPVSRGRGAWADRTWSPKSSSERNTVPDEGHAVHLYSLHSLLCFTAKWTYKQKQ
jgi:hypothetical protein